MERAQYQMTILLSLLLLLLLLQVTSNSNLECNGHAPFGLLFHRKTETSDNNR